MHIIAGRLKGTSLKYPKDKVFRPTQSKIREAIFNILGDECDGSSILDLCCGTGSLGMEAISRGAEHAIFVDTDCKTVKDNLKVIHQKLPGSIFKAMQQSAPQFVARCKRQFDIIFFDPPWKNQHLYERTLMAISEFDILSEGGILVVESSKDLDFLKKSPFPEPVVYKYGDTRVLMFKK